MTKVSVIIPTCNRPDLINGAVESVLAQTYQDFEIIVVDDGIKQRAKEIIDSINDKRIRYIQHEKNKGGAAARNTGIKNAKGKYIAFLDDDDEWKSNKLEVQMSEFEKTGDDVGFCFSAVTQKRDEGEYSSTVRDGTVEYYEESLRNFKGILTSSLIIKKQVFDRVGFFDENFPSHQEAELIIRISKYYKGLGINKSLVIMTVFGDHESVGKSLPNKINGRKKIIKKYLVEFKKRPKVLATHYFQLGIFCRDNKEYFLAKNFFLKSIKNNPKSILYWKHFIALLFGNNLYKYVRSKIK